MKQIAFMVGLVVMLACTSSVVGSPVVDGGISSVWPSGIEATHTIDTVTLTSGSFGSYVPTELPAGGFGTAGLNQRHAIGALAFGMNPNDGIALGDNDNASAKRGLVRMSLYGARIKDVAGPDLYVSEEGSIGGCEGWMLRVSTDNCATFTPWRYRQEQVQYNPVVYTDFFTGFDLVGDFGLAPGATVSHVEVQNANLTDRVSSSTGQGQVVFAEDPGYGAAFTLTAGPLNSAGDIAFGTNRFDADVGYMFYGASVAVLPGDANRSGTTDATDLNTVLSFYNQNGTTWETGDFNRDGHTDATDLNSVLSYYNQTSGGLQMGSINTSTVPEPSSIVMLASLAALFGAWVVRRR